MANKRNSRQRSTIWSRAPRFFGGRVWRSRAPRRRLFLEPLEQRQLLAITDLAAIGGVVFDDFSGDGADPGELVAGAALDLYADDGDGLFQPGGADGAPIASTTTDASGEYQFDGLSAGGYFVRQPAQSAGGATLLEYDSSLITITSTDAMGVTVLPIDTFDSTTQSVTDTTNDATAVTSALAASEAVGNERDLFVNLTSAVGSISLRANDLAPGLLAFDSASGGGGERLVTWDGPDADASLVDDTGLGSLNLTASDATGIKLLIGADLAGANAVVRIFSDDGVGATQSRFSTQTTSIPVTGGVTTEEVFLPFSGFTTGGTAADFADAGAIQVEITGSSNVNGFFDLVGTAGPTIFTADFANFEQADLSVTKTVDTASPNVGDNVTFTVTLTNDGPDAASAVTLSDLLPAGLTFVSATESVGTYDDVTGVWSVGSLADGSSETLSLVALVDSIGVKTNTAEVAAADQFDPDSTPNNDVGSEDDQDAAAVTPQVADLSIAKTVDNASPNVGDNITFTVAVANAGPDAATNVTVGDTLPAGVTFVSATPSQGSYDDVTGVWTVGTVANGGNASLQIVASVDTAGTKTNTAQVTASDQADPDSTPNNSVPTEDDQNDAAVTPQVADLSVTKTVDNAAPNVGDQVTFVVTLTNDGPQTATNVAVADPLPVGVTFVSAAPSQGSYDDVTGIWTVGTVTNGSNATLQIVASVDSTGTKTNTAQVSAVDQVDSDSVPNNSDPSEDDQDDAAITPQVADLSVTKTVSDTAPNVGDNVVFTVTVDNSGPDAATNVAVGDTLPTGMSFVSATPSQGSYDSVAGVWTVGTLANGANATLQIVASVDTTGTKTNTAQVTAADQFDADSTPNNNAAAEDDQDEAAITPRVADLSVTKTVDNAAPSVSDNVTFTVVVMNDGPDAATNVLVGDSLPSGMTFVSATASQGSYDNVAGVWTVGTVANGGNASLQIIATVDSAGTKTNTAQVTAADQADSDSTPNNDVAAEDDQDDVAITPEIVDLSISKTVNNASPNVGDNVTFSVTVANDGPGLATNVTVGDTLPVGVTFVSATASQGSYDNITGVWSVGSIANGGTATLQVVASVDSAGTKVNTAEVIGVDQTDSDSTPNNSIASEDDQDDAAITPQSADLSLNKTVNDATPNVGDSVTFTVTITNDGPDAATNVTVGDSLPAGLTFVSATSSQGSYDNITGVWTVGTLANAGSASLQIVASVDSSGAKTNTAEVTAADQADADSNPNNGAGAEDDQADATVTPQVVDLSLSKTVDAAAPNVGDNVTFTVTVSNAGPDAATNVTVGDSLPVGMTFVSATPSQGNFDNNSGSWTVGTLASAGSATLQIVASVDSTGSKTNTAQVTAADQFDSDSTPNNGLGAEDDQDDAVITPQIVDLAVMKTVDNATPDFGDNITFTVTVTNDGPNTATNLTVSDSLPAGLTFVSATPSVGAYDSSTGIWTVGSLANGGSATLQIVATVSAFAILTNTAQIAGVDQFDPDSTPNNNADGEDDLASVLVTAPLRFSKRLFLAR